MEARGSVNGPQADHQVDFYGISTCIWCRRTRKFLEEQGVSFDFTYVDLLEGEEQQEVLEQVRQWNPRTSFPTLVVDESESIVGYKPDQIKKALGL